jgi:type VI secretion system Hcp family effector
MGQYYVFVKFEANGTTVTGNTDITTVGGEELDRAEWIQCRHVKYGLKRDISTGARVSGHTHYDRIELDCPQGPSTPMLMQALERGHTVNCTIRFYHNRRDGQEEKYMEIVCTDGRLSQIEVLNDTRPVAEGTSTVEGDARQRIEYAFHQMQIDHVGEDGSTSAHFDWSGSNQA